MKRTINILVITILIISLGYRLYSTKSYAAKDVVIIPTYNEGCIGLNYHRVLEPTLVYKLLGTLTQSKELTTYNVYEDDFENQMRLLKGQGVYFATPQELIKFSKTNDYPNKCVWISFDDGDESIYKKAYPILKEMNIPFTMFLISGQIGNENFNNLHLLDKKELQEMNESGLVTFGSHTHDMHRLKNNEMAMFLYKEHYDQFKEDVTLSKTTLETLFEVPITTIAYPFGETNDDVTKIVKEAGYEQAAILSPNPITPKGSQYYLNRYLISQTFFEQTIIPWLDTFN